MLLRVNKEYPEKGVAFAMGTHTVVLNDGFRRTSSALTQGPGIHHLCRCRFVRMSGSGASRDRAE